MNPEMYKKHIANGGSAVAVPVSFDSDGCIDKSISFTSFILGAISNIWAVRKSMEFLKVTKKQKYLQRMSYCRMRKKRVHAYKKKSSYYRALV